METNIWINGRFTDIKPDQFVNTTKNVHSFCVCNGLTDRLFKSQGGYYKLQKDGRLTFIVRALNQLTFEGLYAAMKD